MEFVVIPHPQHFFEIFVGLGHQHSYAQHKRLLQIKNKKLKRKGGKYVNYSEIIFRCLEKRSRKAG
jgi:hypothetical protein